jgi:hypothetical protein
MPFNRAIIPLYLNSDILNNLFSIVVQEFVEVKSVSTRDQVVLHLRTPISELSYDLFGKYIQGDCEFQLLNEFAKQRTEQKISAAMIVLQQLRDILLAQSLLKLIHGNTSFDSVEEHDFIDFPCRLNKNPILWHADKMVGAMEINNSLNDVNTDENLTKEERVHQNQMLAFFKERLNSCKSEKCLRYIANEINNTDTRIVVPIKTCCLLDNEDYLLNGKVHVMGKVVKINRGVMPGYQETAVSGERPYTGYTDTVNLLSDTIFDHINFNQFNYFQNKFLDSDYSNLRFDRSHIEPTGTLVEVLPIVIYI